MKAIQLVCMHRHADSVPRASREGSGSEANCYEVAYAYIHTLKLGLDPGYSKYCNLIGQS